MHSHDLSKWEHSHRFTAVDGDNQRRTAVVAGLTAVTMVVEITAGMLSGSMALLADGWHMGTHLAALSLSVFAYWYARRHADNRGYTFGTGKVGVLGGFSSAIILAVAAVLMAAESVRRILQPEPIHFNEAIAVAVIGLAVNFVSAVILRRRHPRHGAEEHSHHHDHNLRSAYLHVVADALTSFLAIFALLAAKHRGFVWMDPAMGIVGGLIIARWSLGLIRDTGAILLDGAADPDVGVDIRRAIEADSDNRVSDLHVWKVGGNQYAAIISLVTDYPKPPAYYKGLVRNRKEIVHLTVEVIPCTGREP